LKPDGPIALMRFQNLKFLGMPKLAKLTVVAENRSLIARESGLIGSLFNCRNIEKT
jgi:hypothetical protein